MTNHRSAYPSIPLHVAVAVIVNAAGEVLISRRHAHVHQAGLWEFPGGKLEPGENVQQALRRELDEELGIQVLHARPLIRVPYRYPEYEVLLDVWRVDTFSGKAHGKEGQVLVWAVPNTLEIEKFPLANRPIIMAARLPERYLITPEPVGKETETFLEGLWDSLQRGISLVQLRAPALKVVAYDRLASRCLELCRKSGARLLLNTGPERVERLGADGVHLNSRRLLDLQTRPLPTGLLVAASCHNESELSRAEQLGLDFSVVSPVLPTASHPDVQPIGWEEIARLVDKVTLPVYALGGLVESDLPMAWQQGTQGIAAIRGLWGPVSPRAEHN